MPTSNPKYNVILTENVNPNELQRRSWCMPISLPLPITQSFLGTVLSEQKERLSSILQYVVTQSCCSSFTIVLADTLQRFAIMNAENVSEKDALLKIKELAQPFVDMLMTLINEYKEYMRTSGFPIIEINVVRWDEALQSDKCQPYSATIEERKQNDKEYLRAIGSTALELQKSSPIFDMSPPFMRKVYENNLRYVTEECMVYIGWNYDVILHPVKATEAIIMTHEIFVKPESTNILHYVIFKLKQNKQLPLGPDVLRISSIDSKQKDTRSMADIFFTSIFRYIQEHPDQMQLGIMFVKGVIEPSTDKSQKYVSPPAANSNISLAANMVFSSRMQQTEKSPRANVADAFTETTETNIYSEP